MVPKVENLKEKSSPTFGSSTFKLETWKLLLGRVPKVENLKEKSNPFFGFSTLVFNFQVGNLKTNFGEGPRSWEIFGITVSIQVLWWRWSYRIARVSEMVHQFPDGCFNSGSVLAVVRQDYVCTLPWCQYNTTFHLTLLWAVSRRRCDMGYVWIMPAKSQKLTYVFPSWETKLYRVGIEFSISKLPENLEQINWESKFSMLRVSCFREVGCCLGRTTAPGRYVAGAVVCPT